MRRFSIAEVTPESADVTSFALEPVDGRSLLPYELGQFVPAAVDVPGVGRTLAATRSAAPDPRRHRISWVKRQRLRGRLHTLEPVAGSSSARPRHVRARRRASGRWSCSARASAPPPVLSMLHDPAAAASRRCQVWLHGARNGREHPFREVRELVGRLPDGHLHVYYKLTGAARDRTGHDHHADGRITAAGVCASGVPADAEHYRPAGRRRSSTS